MGAAEQILGAALFGQLDDFSKPSLCPVRDSCRQPKLGQFSISLKEGEMLRRDG